ncbi:MAG TPA: glycoside hydrolase family 9 protein [Verrucomicrobiae bacterium]|nr:glycoside hydrolase family 9 protein [Verrucomicrobiae bacterium]
MAVSLVAPFAGRAGNTAEYSVQVSANVKASPAQITLTWPQDTISTPKDYLVYRRAPGSSSWGNATTLPGSTTTYVDNNVVTGVPYEYQIVKQTAGYTGYGYIYSGIDVPLTENRGTLLLVVDNTYAPQLVKELTRLQQDLVGDGWTVSRINVSRSDSPVHVKSLIKAKYNQDPANTKGVFLFGHVPVPYSGDIVPDGHYANHQGAWPCDGYYADMNGTWTDNTVDDTSAEDARNHNVPGDGKFDQSKFPAPLTLMIGRVDLANMPGRMSAGGPATFPSELELLRNYLNKDHNFRNKTISAPARAIVGDYFGVRDGEAFAASGWRNFAPLLGANKITTVAKEGTWLPTLRTNAYLFAYGCGSGSYTSIGGIGSVGRYRDGVTTELVQDDVKAVFTLLYGSWLGDWDSEDNIQRAVLATKDLGLTCSWSGRPHWFMHHMALGEPIGYSARLTQNDGFTDLYKNEQNNCESWTHIALMGDPTLRMQMVAPASDVTVADNDQGADLTWTPSSDSVAGYNVYRATNPNGPFTRLNSALVKDNTFTDANATDDSFTSAPGARPVLAMTGRTQYYYMVRAVKLEKSASGTYFNPSEGAFASARGTTANVNVANAATLVPKHPVAVKPQAKADYSMALGRDLPPTGATSVDTIWFDDTLPTGAVKDGNVDTWNWVNKSPTAESGKLAHESKISTGLHQHMFTKAKQTLKVNTGDTVYTYVYLDPANVPSEVMLQWNDGSTFYHRAYWGANNLSFTSPTAASLVYMGPLPAAGQWVRLEVPASTVGLEGVTVSGMAFSLYGGRATWDNSGKSTPVVVTTPPPDNNPTNPPPTNPTNSVSSTNDTSWVDDSVPAGAATDYSGGDTWNWVTASPSPELGTKAHQSAIASGLHQHFFNGATAPLQINTGDKLYTYVYVDPANPPTEIMLQWSDGSSWEHRAYWGANSVAWGTDNTPGLYRMGTIPTAGQWVRLEVPASNVGLEGSSVVGMAFTLYGGRVTWDNSGKSSVVATNSTSPTNSPTGTNTLGNLSVWFDDALPTGAAPDWNVDTWNWTSTSPNPESGTRAHQSAIAAGLHQHFFTSASQTMSVATGDILYTYVYIDPANVPSELMLQWNDGASWEHRAYWGGNSINMGTDGTTGRHYMGPMPATGQWVQLQVPASAVALEGSTVSGMAFTLNDGRVTWDNTGKGTLVSSSPGNPSDPGNPTNNPPPVTNSPLAIALSHPADNTTYAAPVTMTLRATTSGGSGTISKVAFYSGATEIGEATGSPYSFNWSNVGAGTYSVTAAATDGSGATVLSTPVQIVITNAVIIGTNPPPPDTNLPPATNNLTGPGNWLHAASADDVACLIPQPGDYTLHVLTPTLLELKTINSAASGSLTPSTLNLVSSSYSFLAPSTGLFGVTVNGKAVAVTSVGFKRRPLYAPLYKFDLRVDNNVYLQLASPISDNDVIKVTNPSGALWNASTTYSATADPLRFNPAIHVNQEGYMPNYSKKAMIGYWAGSMGEVSLPVSSGFTLVDANSGATVFSGTLAQRLDSGWNYSPAPYQKVYEADFTSFTTPGQYRLVVPGMGASLPFNITDGIAMAFARTYALGLYNQRCGTSVSLPWSRYTHDACHTAAATIPWPPQNYAWTWQTIDNYGTIVNPDNPTQTAPKINENTLLFPYVNQGKVDVSGGHHDAGDYSKYMTDSAAVVHALMFAVDSLPGVAQLDNMGIPESGDGVSDVMQEAKWEADYIAKMQDADGGFYFIVYPTTREYESDVTPDHGDPQIVWPKTSTATAAAVAALAQCASSPAFKAAYPQVAASYLAKAKLGWTFLTNAIAKYGKNGIYQKITHYGDTFADQDELAWAACEMFLATGDQGIHQTLMSWFDPSSSATWRWGWWHMPESYGNAIRSYAFAARSGRLQANQLNSAYLAKCQAEIAAAGDMQLGFAQASAYGTSFPTQTKAVQGAGWYFSQDQAFDMTVAYQLNPKTDYMTAILENMNYEGGCNPANVCYLTGLGWKRQRDVVSQYALNDKRLSPPSGEPVGNVESSFSSLWTYPNNQIEGLVYPQDSGTTQYPFYDRWGDSWNVQNEFVILNQARSLGNLAFLAAQTSLKNQAWKSVLGQITITPVDSASGAIKFSLSAPGVDLSSAKIVWETRDADPTMGQTFTFTPKVNDNQWVEAEATLPDGRRIFGTNSFVGSTPNVTWVDDAAPAGSEAGSDGGDPWDWNWVSSNPTPQSGQFAFQSAIVAGEHQYLFLNATATMTVPTGATLFAYIYIDPANPPSEVMMQWNDGSSWDHRAYWGANNLTYGTDGTVSRYNVGALPGTGQWVKLAVPASAVGLEGKTLTGMGFTLYGGRATWDDVGETTN